MQGIDLANIEHRVAPFCWTAVSPVLDVKEENILEDILGADIELNSHGKRPYQLPKPCLKSVYLEYRLPFLRILEAIQQCEEGILEKWKLWSTTRGVIPNGLQSFQTRSPMGWCAGFESPYLAGLCCEGSQSTYLQFLIITIVHNVTQKGMWLWSEMFWRRSFGGKVRLCGVRGQLFFMWRAKFCSLCKLSRSGAVICEWSVWSTCLLLRVPFPFVWKDCQLKTYQALYTRWVFGMLQGCPVWLRSWLVKSIKLLLMKLSTAIIWRNIARGGYSDVRRLVFH